MKNIITLLFTILWFSTSFSQSEYVSEHNGAKHLWGVHEPDALLDENYKEWYDKSSVDYEPQIDIFNTIEHLKEAEVTIYLGTWCGDTKKWVPKFIKLWEALDLPKERIKLIALHNESDHYKQGPNGEEKGAHIHKVPTFIITKNGEEIGRIVERPLTSLEIDLAQIDKGIPAEPRYQAVNWLQEYFTDTTDPAEWDIDVTYQGVRRKVSKSGELNTYGYVLYAANEVDKARFVFELNTRLFSFDPKAYDNLGELYRLEEDWQKAKDCFQKILSLNPGDERAINMLYEINQALADL